MRLTDFLSRLRVLLYSPNVFTEVLEARVCPVIVVDFLGV
jgi:hypothetical protein